MCKVLIKDCYIKAIPGDQPIKHFDNGTLLNLDGYAIIPLSEYEELKALAATQAVRQAGATSAEGITTSSHEEDWTGVDFKMYGSPDGEDWIFVRCDDEQGVSQA